MAKIEVANTYRAIWLKEGRLMSCCTFDNFEDAKKVAEVRFATFRDRFDATAAIVEDAFGSQVHFYNGDGAD